ncbi:PspA/IM30 family protein [Pseudogracilibacillus auburnensis]|uniref:Phage shock protein A (PspA) family protein n=1 Tax=Pseudogracilibacillus auburnensis TaxID=1494959 RepID=A0A2V3VTQ9_9BACI|nr:PspA/IM30 family protein [Pseudogracilibacillus auburnensis]MBO1004278.1 PspA/IM30 family protein [Pseudogracilibacillus auburnensis]PXW85030.1 phage shock protein A (PspA) family protein [Pseudogracilibacillus auburnensis]
MANIFTRIKDSISADVHQLLDEKEQKNPIASLNHYLRQSELQKDKVKKLLERHYKLRDEFTTELHQAEDRANKRLQQANIAKAANESDLYEFAMQEYKEYHMRAERMKEARQNAVNQIDQLERKYKEMNHKLKDMHLKRMELMGRENLVRANHQMNKVMDEDVDKPFSRFAELEKFIENLESKVNQAYYQSTFDQKIAQLEKEMKERPSEAN